MRYIQREIADDYQEFFNFLNQEHNLILTISEMAEIVFEAQKLVKKLTIPAVISSVCHHNGTYTATKDDEGNEICCKCKKPLAN